MNNKKYTSYVIVDVEATGSNYGTDLVFEMAAIFLEQDKVAKQFHSFIKIPESRMYQARQQLQHVINIDVAKIINARSFLAVFEEFIQLVNEYEVGTIKFVAHNVLYDYSILYNNAKQMAPVKSVSFYKYFNAYKLDTVNLAKKIFPNSPRYSLDAVANYIISNENNQYLAGLMKQRSLHGALIDVKILTEVFLNIKNKNPFLVY